MKLLTIELLEAVRKTYPNLKLKNEKTKARQIMTEIIRKYCDTIPVTFVSSAAKKKAEGINLFKMNWSDQKKFDSKRLIFHLEHKTTVRDTVKSILEGQQNAKDAIENIEFGWILKKEDVKLNEEGFRFKRDAHDDAYKKCGISIIPSPK